MRYSDFYIENMGESMENLELIWKGGTWLAQSVDHATLDLKVMSLSPTLGVEPTLKNKSKLVCKVWPDG